MAVYKRGKGDQGLSHFPKKFITLRAAGAVAIAKGDLVAIDLDDDTNGLGGSVEKSTTALPQLAFGIATQAVPLTSPATPKNIVVQVAGKYGVDGGSAAAGDGAFVATSVAAGDFLVASTAAAGTLVEADSATAVAGNSQANIQAALKLARIGIALTADADGDYTAGYATVMIIDQGLF